MSRSTYKVLRFLAFLLFCVLSLYLMGTRH